MKTAFVTGGAGFLGLNLIEQLAAEGWNVVAFDIDTSRAKQLQQKGIVLVEGDITDLASCHKSMPENVTAVFHLAGDTTHWKMGNRRQTSINLEGTWNMIQTALKKNTGRFVFTSSIGAYGTQTGKIVEETASTAMDSAINYWQTKWLAEQKVRQGIAQGLDAVIVNPANIIGPYDFSGWSRLFWMIDQGKLAGAPPGAASFCYSREVARAHVKAYEKGRTGHNYLLGGADATWLEFIQQIGRLLGRKVPQKPMPPFLLHAIGRLSLWASYITRKEPDVTPEKAALVCTRLVCSSKKAQKELDYQAVPLNEMLTDCYQWLRATKLLHT